jgi:hypothetical protein
MKFRTAAAALLTASAANAGTLLVPQQFGTIQQAIDSASNGDVIQVSAGTYHEQINLSGKAIELVGVDGGARATIDGDGVRVCIVGSGEPAACVVRGFVIRNGSFAGSTGGGGVSLSNSAATFRDCDLIGNSATGDALWSGGAFHSLGGNETIEDCRFIGNRGWNQSSASAIYHYRRGSLTVRRCLFDSNKGNYLGQAGEGRGTTVKVHSEFEGATATIEACMFIATESGGSAAYQPDETDGEVYAFSPGTSVQVLDSTFVCGPAVRPCAVGTDLSASIHAIRCSGCGYGRTANGNVVVTDSDTSARCTDCDGDGTKDLEQVIRNPALDADGDGVLDACVSDCNSDGIPDSTQLAAGQLADFDGSGVPDCCERGEACVVGSYPVQWRVADGGNGHWYESKIFGPTMTGESARLYASQRGSYLVSITSPAESDFVRSISAAPEFWGNSFLGPMIGMYRDEAGCSAGCWDSGEPVSYTNWHPGNPDPHLERCVYLYIFGTAVWQDYSCELPGWGSNAVSAILEWSADCNNDGFVDYGQILNGQFADINRNGVPDRICECIGDLYVDGFVNGADLGALLAYWGPVTGAPASQAADIDRDGVVNGSDLGILLAGWGACAP